MTNLIIMGEYFKLWVNIFQLGGENLSTCWWLFLNLGWIFFNLWLNIFQFVGDYFFNFWVNIHHLMGEYFNLWVNISCFYWSCRQRHIPGRLSNDCQQTFCWTFPTFIFGFQMAASNECQKISDLINLQSLKDAQ